MNPCKYIKSSDKAIDRWLILIVAFMGLVQSGCATGRDYSAAAGYRMMADDPSYTAEQRRAFAAMAMANEAQLAQDREIADRSRSQRHLDVNEAWYKAKEEEVKLQVKKWATLREEEASLRASYRERKLFACNFYMDFDRDNCVDWDEFVWIKKCFGQDEDVTVVFGPIDRKGSRTTLQLWDKHGRVVNEWHGEVLASNWVRWHKFSHGTLQPGTYAAVLSVEGEHFGTVHFEIVSD